MKKLFVTILLIATLVMFTGCASLTPNQNARIASTAHVAAYIGTTEALRAHPEWRPGFVLAAQELKYLEDGPVDVLKLMEIVRRLPVKELKSDRAALYITAGTILLTDQIGTTPIEHIENLKPVISAIRQGIERGL